MTPPVLQHPTGSKTSHATIASSPFLEHYRCPAVFGDFRVEEKLSADKGYFRFGPQAICYGKSSSGFRAPKATAPLHDVLSDVRIDGRKLILPFCPADVLTNLRHEHYARPQQNGRVHTPGGSAALQRAYYLLRPLLGVSVRKHLQRRSLRNWKNISFPSWPVDCTVERVHEGLMSLALRAHAVERIPFIWFWPDGHQSCASMTHDIETRAGRDFCAQMMDLDEAHGIKSAFQVVPEERYAVPQQFVNYIRNRGFEVNVHGLNHQGDLFGDRDAFLRQVERINMHGRAYQANGFRSPVLYRNADWFDSLEFAYDMSIPNVAHLDPQRGGCCTVMPFFIGKLLELPVTTTQDYSLFHILDHYSTEVWEQQLATIQENHGMASFIVHPDYVIEPRARKTYKKLLERLADLRSRSQVWLALPGEVNRWWRQRSKMTLRPRGDSWEIEGEGKERAQVAYAKVEGNRVVYRLQAILGPCALEEPLAGLFGFFFLALCLLVSIATAGVRTYGLGGPDCVIEGGANSQKRAPSIA